MERKGKGVSILCQSEEMSFKSLSEDRNLGAPFTFGEISERSIAEN